MLMVETSAMGRRMFLHRERVARVVNKTRGREGGGGERANIGRKYELMIPNGQPSRALVPPVLPVTHK